MMTAATDAASAEPGTAVAKRDNSPRGLIEQYSGDFANVLPSHIKAATWVRVAQGALKKGKKIAATDGEGRPVRDAGGQIRQVFELEQAAANNPAAFLSALLDAARQGLEPGTEQYYLTARKVGGRLEILGMRGYQGEIELIYRAGASATVIAEVVREKDTYRYRRGVDDKPLHEYPPFAGESTRGKLIGVYAYAVMKDGAISRVVEMGQEDIDRVKSFAQGLDSKYSPWNTSEPSMWLKSAIHQLQKWVPTSAEYITTQVRAQLEGETPKPIAVAPLRMQNDLPDVDPNRNGDTFDENIVDAEVVAEPGDEQPPDGATPPAEPPAEPGPEKATKVQVAKLSAVLNGNGVRDKGRKLAVVAQIADREIGALEDLTKEQADAVIDTVENIKDREAFEAIFGGGQS
jgi:recombination protein RecT